MRIKQLGHSLFLSLLGTGLILGPSTKALAAGTLDLIFDNPLNQDVWINFDNGGGAAPTPFDVTYNGGTAVAFDTYQPATGPLLYNSLSSSIHLSDVTNGTFTVSSVSSVAVFVTYGTPFSSLQTAPGFFANSTNGTAVFQNFELTRTGGNGDQGNLTNINYFTAPLSIKSYTGGINGTLQQSVGYNQTTAQIASQLAATSSSNTVSSNGQVIRYVGPSTYSSNPPYPSFVPYLQSIHTSGVTNQIVKANAFNTPGPTNVAGSKNYNFQINYTSTVGADGTINLTGSITTQIKDNFTGITTAGPTFAGANVVISGANAATLNSIIYGQAIASFGSAVTFGSGWTDFQAYVNDPSNNIQTSGAYDTTQNMATGEITTAILMGFLGNTSEVNGVALNTMESQNWWLLNPLQAFSEIQTDPNYYNQWANVIYSASNNGVYGIPYSDRLGTGPLVNSVQYNGDDIDTWVVGIGEPVTAVPEPGTVALLGLGIAGIFGFRFLRQRRKI